METYAVSFIWRQPHRCRLFAADHEIDVVLGAEAMGDGRQETIRVGGKVDTRELGLEIQDGTDEGRVLMGESIMLLAGPCRGFKVVEGATRLTPGCLGGHFRELRILNHHSLDNAQESFITGEEPCAASQSVSLEHSLASMLRQNFDDTPAFATRGNIPLEVAAGVI